ncbi:TATA box-binding protein-associated factor RNA polymerase I subunit C isoform X6 [Suricata suricatta]|uniref:TATA box-binding protein-associated factor RNA polymerase I subunit C isoform X6 n=2 Tax=Suricata suricatta TaxID=37032 RepID=UPI0011559589|nr:TATA box-binding protein-associated factor RNA polymerase I subunit C isoform X6 [Suricata suricatta]XP_029780066.1 TATA box-binding protein-associated factor RNA polymerase I subunit C isoform X6 [Suricata suricatta]
MRALNQHEGGVMCGHSPALGARDPRSHSLAASWSRSLGPWGDRPGPAFPGRGLFPKKAPGRAGRHGAAQSLPVGPRGCGLCASGEADAGELQTRGSTGVPGLPSASGSAASPSLGGRSWARRWPASWGSCCTRSWPCGGSSFSWTMRLPGVIVSPSGDPRTLGDPGHIWLRGPVRQVVTRTVQGESLLAVRSDYHCALWKVSKQGRPVPLQVLQVGKGATGISLSPHLPGELAVCSRSGTVCLWTPQDGLQQIYKDPETLVFRDPSPWRWADFTAHPRVLTVGDRTGVKIVDTQGPPGCGLLLFRGGAEAACQKGERVLLAQCLGGCGPEPLHPTLHLILTQFSLYLVDERLPLVPLLKWEHELPSAPLFAQLLPPARPGHARPLLLGAQGGDLRLLQLAGAGTSAPRLAGPPQSLPSSSDSLSAFPLLEPKSQWRLQERLKAPTIGLVATVPSSTSTPALLLFQLSAAGDVFHQCLRLQEDPGPDSRAPTASWSPQATARCGHWLKGLLEVPSPPPVWTAPAFSHRRVLGCVEQRQGEQRGLEGLRAAMAEGRLLLRRDLGAVPSAEPPPAPEPGPEDELRARLEAAWEGRAAAWWERQQGGSSGPGRRPKRPKRRTQLSSTFSSLSGRLDPSDATSPPPSPRRASPEAGSQAPVTPPPQKLTQEPWAQRVPSERRQTLRDYMAKLPLQADTPGGVSSPLSQASSVQATPSGQQALQEGSAKQPIRRHTLGGAAVASSQASSGRATPSGSQPPRKRPRMGF